MENKPFSDWQGKTVGRYQLQRLLGRGGTSEVWLATDTQLRRQVALKILPPVLTSEQDYLRGFAYEARAAASLEHPHILGVHDFGEQVVGQGEVVPYLVMPYVPGGTLRERMLAAQGPLPVQESLHYLRQAAQAIDYAHSKGLVHRDIKPANMLLRADWLLLTDFGIAKVLNSSTARGQTYAGSGTPAYMAPEQITGQAVPASDRYSLAVVAYELFAGREPFPGATPSETISLHLQGQFPAPRGLNPQIPHEVERLLLLALSRQPEARPPSCIALVDALQQAWMSGVQVQPDPDSTLLAPWSKRAREMSSALSQLPSSGGLSGPSSRPPISSPALPLPRPGGTPVPNTPNPAVRGHQTATDPNAGSPAEVFATATDPFATDMATGRSSSNTNTSPPRAMGSLEKKVGRRTILVGGSIAAVAVVSGSALAFAALNHKPDGPVVTPTPASGPQKLIPGTPVLELTGHTDEVWVASWDPSGRYLMTAGNDGYIMLWDLTTALQNSTAPQKLSTPHHKWTVANIKFTNITDAVCWSPDGQKLIAGDDFTEKVYVLDAFGASDTPTIYDNINGSANGNTAIYSNVAAGPLKNHFSVSNSAEIQVWNLAHTDQPEISYIATGSGIDLGAMAWSRDGSLLAARSISIDGNDQLFLWQSGHRTLPQSWQIPSHNTAIAGFVLADTIAWSPIDPNLLLLSAGDVALIWDMHQQKPVLTLGAQGQGVSASPAIGKLSWSPNGRYVAASYDKLGNGDQVNPLVNPRIFVWDVQTLLKTMTPASTNTTQGPTHVFASQNALQHSKSIVALSWSPDGRYLATSSLDKTVIIWKVDGD